MQSNQTTEENFGVSTGLAVVLYLTGLAWSVQKPNGNLRILLAPVRWEAWLCRLRCSLVPLACPHLLCVWLLWPFVYTLALKPSLMRFSALGHAALPWQSAACYRGVSFFSLRFPFRHAVFLRLSGGTVIQF